MKTIEIKCSKCYTEFEVYGKHVRGRGNAFKFFGNLRPPDRCPKHECKKQLKRKENSNGNIY